MKGVMFFRLQPTGVKFCALVFLFLLSRVEWFIISNAYYSNPWLE